MRRRPPRRPPPSNRRAAAADDRDRRPITDAEREAARANLRAWRDVRASPAATARGARARAAIGAWLILTVLGHVVHVAVAAAGGDRFWDETMISPGAIGAAAAISALLILAAAAVAALVALSRRAVIAEDLRIGSVVIERLAITRSVRVIGTWWFRRVAWILGDVEGKAGSGLVLHGGVSTTPGRWVDPMFAIGPDGLTGSTIELVRLPRSGLVVGQTLSGPAQPVTKTLDAQGFGAWTTFGVRAAVWRPPAHGEWVPIPTSRAIARLGGSSVPGLALDGGFRARAIAPADPRLAADPGLADVTAPEDAPELTSRRARSSDLRAARIGLARDIRNGPGILRWIVLAAWDALRVPVYLVPMAIVAPHIEPVLALLGFCLFGLLIVALPRILKTRWTWAPVVLRARCRADVAAGDVEVERSRITAAAIIRAWWFGRPWSMLLVDMADGRSLTLPVNRWTVVCDAAGDHRLVGDTLVLERLPGADLAVRIRLAGAWTDPDPLTVLPGPRYRSIDVGSEANTTLRRFLNPKDGRRPPHPGRRCVASVATAIALATPLDVREPEPRG
jgi:hypothetical protein